jgi:hypothetical protein
LTRGQVLIPLRFEERSMDKKNDPDQKIKNSELFPFRVDLILPDGAVLKAFLDHFTQDRINIGVQGSMVIGQQVQLRFHFRCDDFTDVDEITSGRVIQTEPSQGKEYSTEVSIGLNSPLTPNIHPILCTHLENPPGKSG